MGVSSSHEHGQVDLCHQIIWPTQIQCEITSMVLLITHLYKITAYKSAQCKYKAYIMTKDR